MKTRTFTCTLTATALLGLAGPAVQIASANYPGDDGSGVPARVQTHRTVQSTAAAPVQVGWIKHVVDPDHFVFEGTTSGAAPGLLSSNLVGKAIAIGPILHITFDWFVSSGSKSFTARTSGTWNTKTGHVVMNGQVIAGYLYGAQVHEEGQLVDPATLTFEGFLRLLPATAE